MNAGPNRIRSIVRLRGIDPNQEKPLRGQTTAGVALHPRLAHDRPTNAYDNADYG